MLSMCPMLVLTEPIIKGSPNGLSDPRVEAIAPASMGSPNLVPVPWASKYAVSLNSRFALR